MSVKEVIKEALPEAGEKFESGKKWKGSGWGEPVASHNIKFQSDQTQIEPVYYWILDFINDSGWKTEKLVDNFQASPGSGQFVDMNQRARQLQKEGMDMMGALNTVIKSVLNLIYDLKEFEIRLKSYKKYFSEDPKEKFEGMLALKQIFLDNVDIKKGNGSINVLAGQAGFVTLRDLFFTVNSMKELDEQEIVNEQTKRVLAPRLDEFIQWVKYSHVELTKRMKIEKSYLKSQVETIKLYSNWLKPYLDDAEKMRQKGFEGNAALVNAFSTSMFELTLLAKKEEKIPETYQKGYEEKKKYYSCLFINMTYRGHVGRRVTPKGDYGFEIGGVVDVHIDAYTLNEEELELITKKQEETDMKDTMKFSSDMAAESLAALQEDIEYFLKDEEEEKKKKEKKKEPENPFSALFSGVGEIVKPLFVWKKEKKKKEKREINDKEDLETDNHIEKILRAKAAENAAKGAYTVYDIYKKAHGMASAPGDFTNYEENKTKEPEVTAIGALRKWENAS